MRPVLFLIAALFFYTNQNIIIERKLAHIAPITTMMFFHLGTLLLTFPFLLFRHHAHGQGALPHANQYPFLALCILLLFAGDFCFYSAYHSGASFINVAIIAVLLPVLAFLMKFAIDGVTPSATQIIGWICAAAAVFLVSRS